MYGESESEYFSRLEQVGISVTITDLKKLRDSNPLYSAFLAQFIAMDTAKGRCWYFS